MSLAAKAALGNPGPRKKRSRVAEWIDAQTPEDKETAIQLLKDPTWSHAAIYRLFTEEGLKDVEYSAFSQFRRSNYPEGLSA